MKISKSKKGTTPTILAGKTGVKKITPAVAADAAEPIITGKPVKAKKDKVVKIAKYKGATTGMRVMEYQDTTFAANVKAMLTDEELAADWHAEFPNAVNFTTTHVAGARRDYNAGTHSRAFPNRANPQLAQVVMDGDKRRFVTDAEITRAKAVKAEAKVEKTKVTKAAKTPAPVAPVKAAKRAKAQKEPVAEAQAS